VPQEQSSTERQETKECSDLVVTVGTLTDSFDAHAVAYISILAASIVTLAAFIVKQAASV
jgi:hypothetical protein